MVKFWMRDGFGGLNVPSSVCWLSGRFPGGTFFCYQHCAPLDIDPVSCNNFPLCLGYPLD